MSAANEVSVDRVVGRRTVRSRCPVCDGVIESAPLKFGVRAMTFCPHCATLVEVDTEDVPNASGPVKPVVLARAEYMCRWCQYPIRREALQAAYRAGRESIPCPECQLHIILPDECKGTESGAAPGYNEEDSK